MGASASAASAISSTVPTLSVPEPGSVPRCGSCFASTKAASTAASFFPLGSAKGSYTTPGGTPKKTAQVEESPRRPRKRPGHSKLSGEATGTRPRFLEASHCPMSASRFVGTSETSMPSMYATQALSDASLRSSADAILPLPFTSRSLRVRFFGARIRAAQSTALRTPRPALGLPSGRPGVRARPRASAGSRGRRSPFPPRSLYGRPVLDVAVRPPEARRPREHPDVGSDVHRALPVPPHEEREHPAEEGHLLGGHPVPWVRLEPRVEDLGNLGVPVQEPRDPRRVLRVCPHAVG